MVLVCGSRTWTDEQRVREELAALPADTIILHGACPKGADAIADRIARELGLAVEACPADWTRHGKKAGVLRNLKMLDLKPDAVLAFHDGSSRGTAHTIAEAKRRYISLTTVFA